MPLSVQASALRDDSSRCVSGIRLSVRDSNRSEEMMFEVCKCDVFDCMYV